MKQQLNEVKRMQQLAGIITESQLSELYKDNWNAYNKETKGNGKVHIGKFITDKEVEAFAEKLGVSADKLYIQRYSGDDSIQGYSESTTIVDPRKPEMGGKTDEEMKQIAKDLKLA